MIVKIKLNPINFLKVIIHIPGLGKRCTTLGKNPVKRKGDERPNPIDRKTTRISKRLELKAKVKAVPKKGALQGVDSIVANTPDKKSPTKGESVFILPKCFPPGVENSNIPKRFNEKMKRARIIMEIKIGDCN